MPEKRILALGGGQIFMEPERRIAKYLLQLPDKEKPRIGWIGTAKGDLERHIDGFYDTFTPLNCELSHLPLFGRTPDVRQFVMSQDIIFVGGGNTKSMLAVWREWELDRALREAWEAGVVLSGPSAGAICWFQQGVTDSWAGELRVLNCLGFLPGSCCPHYDGETDRRPAFTRFIENLEAMPGVAIDDGAGALFVGDELSECIAGNDSSFVYRVGRDEKGHVTEERLETRTIS